jgi:protein-tyrosine phosphatase
MAIGGGIWNAPNMNELARAGVTHIIDMQLEFDDTPLAKLYGIEVLWNPTDDDFMPKSAELLQRGVDFALCSFDKPEARIYIHCAAGVHRAPMMALAVLCAMGWKLDQSISVIKRKRPTADFVDVYVESVRRFLATRANGRQRNLD